MVDATELQYATMLSSRLERFKITSRNPYRLNFRCPVCLDSQKSKSKARGWLLEDKHQSFHFFCHNCGASSSFPNFLKTIDQLLYNDYIAEKYVSKTKTPKLNLETFKAPAPIFDDPLKKLKNVNELKSDHPIILYLESRKIPKEQYTRIFYTPKFMTWANSVIPNKFAEFKKDHPRLILPFLDKTGKMFGCSARGFDPKGLRYISIMFEDRPKIFGLDKVDFSRSYIVVEGALDSLFLENAVAMAGADGNSAGIENVENAIYAFDSERRNKEIHSRIEKLIQKGRRVCIWPSNMPGKDINDFILSGMTSNEIQNTIFNNVYSGLQASLKLAEWRRT